MIVPKFPGSWIWSNKSISDFSLDKIEVTSYFGISHIAIIPCDVTVSDNLLNNLSSKIYFSISIEEVISFQMSLRFSLKSLLVKIHLMVILFSFACKIPLIPSIKKRECLFLNFCLFKERANLNMALLWEKIIVGSFIALFYLFNIFVIFYTEFTIV